MKDLLESNKSSEDIVTKLSNSDNIDEESGKAKVIHLKFNPNTGLEIDCRDNKGNMISITAMVDKRALTTLSEGKQINADGVFTVDI